MKMAGVAFACLLLFGCQQSPPKGEAGEGNPISLVIYTPLRADIYQPIVKEFEERTGIWVTVVTGDSNHLFAMLGDKTITPRCDVVFGGMANAHRQYSQWLTPYTAQGIEKVNPVFRPSDDGWTPFSVMAAVVVYNTRLVPSKNRPFGWASLLDSDWVGRIASAGPERSSFYQASLAVMAQAFPGQEWDTIAWFASALQGQLMEHPDEVVPAVAEGRFAIGVAMEDAAYLAQQSGKEIAYLYPQEGTLVMADAASVARDAQNRENAQLFIDFLIGKDVQQWLGSGLGRRPVYVGLPLAEGLIPLEEIPQPVEGATWGTEQYNHIPASWRREF